MPANPEVARLVKEIQEIDAEINVLSPLIGRATEVSVYLRSRSADARAAKSALVAELRRSPPANTPTNDSHS